MRIGRSRREIQCDRHHLASEIGCYRGRSGITPPWIADQLLAGSRQAGERVDAARIIGKRGKNPSLCLGRVVLPQLSLERTSRARQTLVELGFCVRLAEGAVDLLLKE
jgi:hypothetical protein